jgi:hypothetical protein
VLTRIKLLLAVVAAMSMLMVVAAPAMANNFDHNDFNRNNFDHNDFDRNDFFIDNFDEEFDEDFVEFDDCELVSFFDEEAVFVCEL